MDLTMFLSISIVAVCLLWYYVRELYSYWNRKNVPGIKPIFPFGNIKGMGRTIHPGQLMAKFYAELKGKAPFGGIFFFTKPVVIALELDFIKSVLIKDFHYFQDRGIYYNEKDDPMSAHLFAVDETKWKALRTKLTPTFTLGKMKSMFPTVVDVAEQFKQCLFQLLSNDDSVIEFRDILARYTTDVVGSCAFGIDCNSLMDPNTEFRKMGVRFFDKPRHSTLVLFFIASFKELARFFRIKAVHDDVSAFFSRIVSETIDYRESNSIQRNDFMQLLIQLKNNGKLDDDDSIVESNTIQDGKLTKDEIAAQALIFFIGGFETSSTTLSFCLYELAQNVDYQEKCRQEIQKKLESHNGQFTYESMMEMRFIDQVISETLRKYSPVVNLLRTTCKDYPVPYTNCTLPRGTLVMIPVYGIHHDAEYYLDPEKFDPARFLPENIQKRPALTYLPFGDGPRNCIGSRFGLMQMKIALITLLQNFQFEKCAKSIVPLEFVKGNLILVPDKGLWLNFKKIKQ